MSTSSPSSDLTPKHIRAARALLAWSQQDLAKAAGVATSTVADFERGQRTPVANNAQAMRGALETAGIRFLPKGAVIGPALPNLPVSGRPGAPVRWVDAEDLSHWANRTDGAVSLPTLVAHLIRATHGLAVQLRFPSDESVRFPGWDGRTTTDAASPYVPQGEAGWEIGAQRSNIAQKAATDYAKRTQDPAPLDPAEAAFIFVTPRRWPDKDDWAKARQADGPWREVRVYDADDLVHWLELTPAVGLWLATRLGKRPAGIRSLEEVWEEWSRATQWPLTQDLVLSDRDEDSAELHRWLRSEPSVMSIQATTADEGVAFFHATLDMLPEDAAEAYRARSVVATDATGARALAEVPGPLIVILSEPDPGLARTLSDRGHFVLQVYDDRPVSRGEVRKLARPSREGIASALEGAGLPEPRARALARDSARNLAVLRRLIPAAPGRVPEWAQEPPPRALLAALLAGGWDDDSEADKARLADLANQPYDAMVADLAPYVGDLDSPLRKVGSTWRMASPPDAWFLLAPLLTPADIGRFEAVADTVLGALDPRFEMNPDERWMASVQGVHPAYSGLLRHGIGEVLILLALWGDRARTVPAAGRRADAIVSKLLRDADPRRWWSLSRDFRLLAEASPGAFLSAIEDSLDQNDPAIGVLFGTDEGGLFGTEHLSDLLWALEALAWSPDLMPRVSHVLARLDAIDTKPSRSLNRPSNSLREIHLLWMPQTYATQEERLRAVDLLRKWEPNAAWKLMMGVLPSGHDSSSPTSQPRWRDFTVDRTETVTWGLIGRGAVAISERLLNDVGLSARRWEALLERLADFAPDREAALAGLDAAEPRIVDPADRAVLWAALRRLLHHHRQFADAEWAMEEDVLDRLEVLYHRFAPADPLDRIAWLFEPSVALPNPSKEGWKGEEREVDRARQAAAAALHAERGIPGVFTLARRVSTAGYLGKALFDAGIPGAELDAVLEAALHSQDLRELDVAHGLIISLLRDRKQAWAEALLARARSEAWGETAELTILRALPIEPWTWSLAAQGGEAIETTYWKRAPVYWISEDISDVAFAIRKLVSVGRARHALPLAERGAKANLPSEVVVEVLDEAARQPFEQSEDSNEATMFQHYVGEILAQLDQRPDVDNDTMVRLEWLYLPILQHSRRPAKVLLKALSEQPELFIRMLSAVFKPSEESGVRDEEPSDPELAKAVAHQAYRLLDLWNRLPGTRDDGTIDGVALEAWIKRARALAKTAGREDIADSKIGNMLSASPMGADGAWPAEAVRDALDLFRSKPMIEGFWVGKSNRRGVTSRMPRDGGALERREAAKYRAWAAAIAYEHPHTSKALDTLAEGYERDAERHDEDVERMDWGA